MWTEKRRQNSDLLEKTNSCFTRTPTINAHVTWLRSIFVSVSGICILILNIIIAVHSFSKFSVPDDEEQILNSFEQPEKDKSELRACHPSNGSNWGRNGGSYRFVIILNPAWAQFWAGRTASAWTWSRSWERLKQRASERERGGFEVV